MWQADRRKPSPYGDRRIIGWKRLLQLYGWLPQNLQVRECTDQ